MSSKKQLAVTLIVFIILAALYRVLPDRAPGFAPHLAMALFAGALIRNRVWAFAFPVVSMLISDAIYQLLYINGLSSMQGFYEGQLTNYVLFVGVTMIGFLIRKVTVLNVALHSITINIVYYLLSNFFVWNSGAGYGRPHSFDGLMLCYADGLPFLRTSLIATFIFSAVLFGGWALFARNRKSANIAKA